MEDGALEDGALEDGALEEGTLGEGDGKAPCIGREAGRSKEYRCRGKWIYQFVQNALEMHGRGWAGQSTVIPGLKTTS